MRLFSVCVVAVLLLAGEVGGQGAVGLADPWQRTVEQFANALGTSDTAAFLPLLADDASFESFDSKSADAIRLLARTQKGAVMAARAYVHAPASMASDIAEGFKPAGIPDEIKNRMIPRNDAHANRSNAIAAEWLGDVLGAKGGDLVGVVVFICDRGTGDSITPQPEVVFVCVKGVLPGGSAAPRIRMIVFGDPLSAK